MNDMSGKEQKNEMDKGRLTDGLYDRLTGLPSMNYFFEIAYLRKDEMIKDGKKPAIVFFDFNGMKDFNNKYGFAGGDKLIIAMAGILKEHFGPESCSRIGGDRFAVVTFEDGLEDKLKIIFEECRSMNEGRSLPIRVGIYPLRMGEVGVALACDRAKMACDINRDSYVSRYAFFSDDMLKEAEKRRYIIENFDKALDEGWIQVYYQPIIRNANGRVCDEEALARWIDPDKGIITPNKFIPVLEDSKLIYKLDLYVAKKIMEKQKIQAEAGIYLVPCSVNISRADFECCDIVEEIRKLVDEAGSSRELLTIEITESTLAEDFDYMKTQIERFQALGFKVWMDDYGSGYSSPIILQKIHFDTIKLDMGFLEKFDEGDDSKIIISALVKMALGLHIDTVVEGVETAQQADFLKEVGCTKLQGYYFVMPIPFEQVMERYEKGTQIGFENPDETSYYASIGAFNLYELSLSVEGEGRISDHFNTMPMAILEIRDDDLKLIRSNITFKDFFRTNVSAYSGSAAPDLKGFDDVLIKMIRQCALDGTQSIMDMKLKNGKKVNMLIRRVSVNPITKAVALVLVVLGITEETSQDPVITYANVALALSSDYISLYHVDLENGSFTEYIPDAVHEDISVERRGEDYFSNVRKEAEKYVYEPDREAVLAVFTEENVLRTISEQGAFMLRFRLMVDGTPVFVELKAIRMGSGNLIIGINNVDVQMRGQKELERLNEERIVYSRISALAGNYLGFYTVDPDTGAYVVYNANADFEKLETSREGKDFFKDARRECKKVVYKEDLEIFQKSLSKAKLLKQIEKNGLFSLSYRMNMAGGYKYVCLKAALVKENGKQQIVIGINDIDERVKRDQEQALRLSAARNRVNLDELTGVKNKHAFIDIENEINSMIDQGTVTPFALVVFDLLGVHTVNDSQGHGAGDELLKQGCKVICDIFQHSPVYRVGGDEFVAITTGRDYDQIDVLMDSLMKRNKAGKVRGGVIVAGGMARYGGELTMEDLFRRADDEMFKNKEELNKL